MSDDRTTDERQPEFIAHDQFQDELNENLSGECEETSYESPFTPDRHFSGSDDLEDGDQDDAFAPDGESMPGQGDSADQEDSLAESYPATAAAPANRGEQFYRGEFQRGVAPSSAKRNFWKVTIYAVLIAVIVGGTIAGGVSWYQHNIATKAVAERDAAKQRELEAQVKREQAETNEAKSLEQSKVDSQKREEAEAQSKLDAEIAQKANIAKVAAEEAKITAEEEKKEALNAKKAAEDTRDQAVAAANEAERLKQEAEKSSKAATTAAQEANSERDKALKMRKEVFEDNQELQVLLGAANINDPTGRVEIIQKIEDMLNETTETSREPLTVTRRVKLIMNLVRTSLRHATSPQITSAERTTYLSKAEERAKELGRLGKSNADDSLVLEAIYNLGRIAEIRGDYRQSLELYQRGLDNAKHESERVRFHAALARVRIEELRHVNPEGTEANVSGNLWGAKVLQASQKRHKIPQILDEALQSAQRSVSSSQRSGGMGAPEAYYSLGIVTLQRAQYFLSINDYDNSLVELDAAAIALSTALDHANTLSSSDYDDLQGTLIQQIINELNTVYTLRNEISQPEQIKAYRQLQERYRLAENHWASAAQSLANLLALQHPLPAETDRTDLESTAIIEWFKPLHERMNAISKDAQSGKDHLIQIDALEESLKRYQMAESTWADSMARIALALKITESIPESTVRWGANKSLTQAWIRKIESRISEYASTWELALDDQIREVLGEALYGRGVHQYFDCNYSAASESFSKAILSDSQDARFYYFRAASKSQMSDPDKDSIFEDMEIGLRLELLSKPSPFHIGLALERIQGPTRKWIEEFRGPQARLKMVTTTN